MSSVFEIKHRFVLILQAPEINSISYHKSWPTAFISFQDFQFLFPIFMRHASWLTKAVLIAGLHTHVTCRACKVFVRVPHTVTPQMLDMVGQVVKLHPLLSQRAITPETRTHPQAAVWSDRPAIYF